MHDQRDRLYDHAIDDVAASLTRAEPGPRVRSAIHRRIIGPATGQHRQSWYAGAAVSAALVCAAVLPFLYGQPDSEVLTEARNETGIARPGDVPSVAQSPSTPSPSGPPAATSQVRLEPAPVAAAATADETRLTIAPIEVAPLNLDDMVDVPTVVVEGLTVNPVEVWQ